MKPPRYGSTGSLCHRLPEATDPAEAEEVRLTAGRVDALPAWQRDDAHPAPRSPPADRAGRRGSRGPGSRRGSGSPAHRGSPTAAPRLTPGGNPRLPGLSTTRSTSGARARRRSRLRGLVVDDDNFVAGGRAGARPRRAAPRGPHPSRQSRSTSASGRQGYEFRRQRPKVCFVSFSAAMSDRTLTASGHLRSNGLAPEAPEPGPAGAGHRRRRLHRLRARAELLERGYRVRVLDRLYWGEEPLGERPRPDRAGRGRRARHPATARSTASTASSTSPGSRTTRPPSTTPRRTGR